MRVTVSGGGVCSLRYLEHVVQQGLNVSRIMIFHAGVVPTLPIRLVAHTRARRGLWKGDTHHHVRPRGSHLVVTSNSSWATLPFIMDLYANSSKTEEFVRRYHDRIVENPDCKTGAAEVIPCGSVKYQVSDMSGIRAYMGLHRDRIYSPAYADPCVT